MSTHRGLVTIALLGICAIAFAPLSAWASVYTWDADTTPPASGGSGTWDAGSTANWYNGSTDVVWPTSGIDNDAVFPSSAGTVTVAAGGVTANDLTFNTSGYIIQGDPLTLNGTTATITTGTGITASIYSEITGSAHLIKSGDGTLTLIPGGNAFNGQPNTFTGGATLEAGTLRVAAKGINAMGTGSFTIKGGTTINLAGNNLQTMNNSQYNLDGDFAVTRSSGNSLKFSTGNATLGADVTTTVANGITFDINGTIDDGGNGYGITKDGPGTLRLFSTANTFTGKTAILNGVLYAKKIDDAGVDSSLGAPTGADATIDIYGGASLRLGRPTGNMNTTNRVVNLAGNGGNSSILLYENDTTLTFNSDLTATGTGAKTLALGVGGGGTGDRAKMVFNGAIPNVSDGSPLSLEVTYGSQTNGQVNRLTLSGVNTYTGSTQLQHSRSGSTGSFILSDSGSMLFDIDASGVNNQIYALAGGPITADFNGTFMFDLTDAGAELGDLWQIVDTASGPLTANYGGTFAVDGFLADPGGDLWTFDSAGTVYQFSESTGALSVLSVAPVPEPSTFALAAIGLIGLACFGWRKRK